MDTSTGYCILGYKEPNWFMTQASGTQAIYTDVIFSNEQDNFVIEA